MSYDPFTGRKALIFGAATGIGRATAIEFARRGANIAIADIDLDGAQAVIDAVTELGRKGVAIRGDVTDAESVSGALDKTEMALGGVDIVMNNVGAIVSGNPEDIPLDEWERLIDINLMGVVRGMTAALPRLINQGSGHIINTASFAGMFPYATNRLPYVASKAGVIAMTESLAIYCKGLGIKVSCLIPGPVITNVADNMKTFGTSPQMIGPGSDLTLLLPEEAASALAEGMVAERILIPTDEHVWKMYHHHADNPDAFIAEKIAQFESGDEGRPTMRPEIMAKIAEMQKPGG